MSRHATTAGTALLALLLATTLSATDPLREKQLQQAVDLLERNDLVRAAALFEAVAASPDPELAARALLSLGEAQQRQGRSDLARAAYQRILQQFTRQAAVAAEARSRIARLEGVAPPGSPAARRVLAGGDADPSANITPDGRLLARVDRRTGDIALRDLTTGRAKRLLVKRDTLEESPDRVDEAIVSSDGSRVAYVWMLRTARNNTRYELRVMRTEPGSPSRVVAEDSRFDYLDPIGWSRDGQSILVTAWRPDGSTQFAWVSIPEGTVRPLKELGHRLGRTRPRLSPDGTLVAYSALPTNPGNSNDRQAAIHAGPLHLYVVPTAMPTDRESELVRGTNINESPIWTPDGKQILFVSNRSDEGFGLWLVPVEKGSSTTERRIRANVSGRIQPIGMTTAGTLYYVPEAAGGAGVDVFIAEFDQANWRIARRPTRLLDTLVDRSVGPSWSPAGDQVAFKRRRASTTMPRFMEPVELVIYSVARQSEENVLTVEGLDDTPPLWLDNDRYLLVRRVNGSLHRLDLKTRRITPLESVAHSRVPVECGSHALAPDGRTLFVPVQDSARTRHVVAFDVLTGEQKDAFAPQPLAALAVMAVSPDQRVLALALQRHDGKPPRLALFDRERGSIRDVDQVIEPRSASWTRSGLFVSRGRGVRNNDVVRVSLPDGVPSPTGLAHASGQFFHVSPDGAHVILSDRTRMEDDELWAYEHLLQHVNRAP